MLQHILTDEQVSRLNLFPVTIVEDELDVILLVELGVLFDHDRGNVITGVLYLAKVHQARELPVATSSVSDGLNVVLGDEVLQELTVACGYLWHRACAAADTPAINAVDGIKLLA